MFHVRIFFVMLRRPPISTRTDTPLPYTTPFQSKKAGKIVAPAGGTYREHGRVVRPPQASRFQERDRRRQPGAGEHIAGRGAPARRGGRRGRLPGEGDRGRGAARPIT